MSRQFEESGLAQVLISALKVLEAAEAEAMDEAERVPREKSYIYCYHYIRLKLTQPNQTTLLSLFCSLRRTHAAGYQDQLSALFVMFRTNRTYLARTFLVRTFVVAAFK